MKKHVFTIMAGCVPVGAKMLETYFKFHTEKINVYIFPEDVEDIVKLVMPEKNTFKDRCSGANKMTIHLISETLKESFSKGYKGSANVMADVIRQNQDSYLIHIDSDVFFKKESLSLIEKAGYPDIYGSRRCYHNNPKKILTQESIEDSVYTYFMGFNPSFLKEITDPDFLSSMIEGTISPIDFSCLGFFGHVFFYMRAKSANVYYESSDLIGGEDFLGERKNSYKSNINFDCGSHLVHIGGVGIGMHAGGTDFKMDENLFSWAFERWNLFYDLFYDKECDTEYHFLYPTKFNEEGKWVSGSYNEEIFTNLKEDLKS
jgi:hypothetical protein